MLKRIQTWGKAVVAMDLMLILAKVIVGVLVGAVALAVVIIQGRYSLVPEVATEIFLWAGFLAFAAWVSADASRAGRDLRRRRHEMAGPDGDLSKVAGIAPRPPWLG
jgi:hypothetical protein